MIPKSAFTNQEGRAKVLDLLTRILAEGGIESYIPAVGPPAALDVGATSVTPGWYAAEWEVSVSFATKGLVTESAGSSWPMW